MYHLIDTNFTHHRKGWDIAVSELKKLHNPNSPVTFYDWADWELKKQKAIKGKWIGFLHNVLTYPTHELPHKYQKKNAIIPLSKLVHQNFFQESLNNCYGLFTMCKNTSKFLQRHVDVPVSFMWHPVEKEELVFDIELFEADPKVVMIGQWMRRYQSIYELDSCYIKKITLAKRFVNKDYKHIKKHNQKGEVELLQHLENKEYDQLLSSSIVFLDLYDAAACNTLLECIVRNTPLLVNILPSTVEYLGINYPMFFTDLEEATEKLKDKSLLLDTVRYLKNMDKTHLDPKNFFKQLKESQVMQNLPTVTLL